MPRDTQSASKVYDLKPVSYIGRARNRGAMSKAIGLRVYKIVVVEEGSTAALDHDHKGLGVSLEKFVHKFVDAHDVIKQHAQEERSWYIQENDRSEEGQSSGLIHYGTFGFESNLIDSKTKTRQYRRQVTDIEEVPLYYEFWVPSDCKVGFAAFQSFQGRSPITLITTSMRDQFKAQNKGYSLYFYKVMPNDVRGAAYFEAPVKKLRLIRRKVTTDITDKYFDDPEPEEVNFEIVVSARRNRSLGPLGSLMSGLQKDLKSSGKSVVTHRGVNFPEAIAEVSFGGRTRRVGVLGANQDAGVIDLTDAVKWGDDGHPTYDSMKVETNAILTDIHDVICAKQS